MVTTTRYGRVRGTVGRIGTVVHDDGDSITLRYADGGETSGWARDFVVDPGPRVVYTYDTAGWTAAQVRAMATHVVGTVADAYRAAQGMPQPTEDYGTVRALPASVTAPWVAAYLDADPTAVPTAAVQASYAALRTEILAQRDAMVAAGFTIEVVDRDPYVTASGAPNSLAMMRDVVEHARIRVLSTRATGGAHALLDDDTNDTFRAVHDFYGHAGTGRSFDADGEEAAYRHHRTMFTRAAVPALTTETRVQNALNNVNGNDFVTQRPTIIPGADA